MESKNIKEEMLNHIDNLVSDLAIDRRLAELTGVMTLEEFDEELNKVCEKWNAHYTDMPIPILILEMMKKVIVDGQGERLMDDLMKGMKE